LGERMRKSLPRERRKERAFQAKETGFIKASRD